MQHLLQGRQQQVAQQQQYNRLACPVGAPCFVASSTRFVTAGMACALLSGMLFMLSATFFGMPVSTTHAIVGAVLGMTVVGAGTACVSWGYPGLLTIVASWFVSPLLAGILSAGMHLVIQMVVFKVTSM